MALSGIDVSHYQAATPRLAGLSFLIAKASEGTAHDPRFAIHVANARRAGLVAGAYHFARDDVGIAVQVDAFLAAAGDVRWLAFDVEGPHAWTQAQTKTAVRRIHSAGREVGLYMSDSAFFDAGQDWDWVANWSHRPARHFDVWQYRGSPLDLDTFEGDLADLRELAGVVWSTDVPRELVAVDPLGRRVLAAIRKTGHNPGAVINLADLAAAMRAAHHGYGTRIDASDVRWLLTWAGTH